MHHENMLHTYVYMYYVYIHMYVAYLHDVYIYIYRPTNIAMCNENSF